MALPVDHIKDHAGVQRGLEFISGRFPLGKRDLADEVLNAFLKAVGAAVGKNFNVGTGTITWPGASTSSNSLAVTHNLGGTPAGYVGFVMGTTGVGSMMLEGTGSSGTTFTVQAFTPSFTPANTATTPIAWIAWA